MNDNVLDHLDDLPIHHRQSLLLVYPLAMSLLMDHLDKDVTGCDDRVVLPFRWLLDGNGP